MVPTLVHNGTPIINSLCINEFIDDVFPDPPLRPADPVERARARYWAWTADDVHLAAALLIHANMLQSAIVKDLNANDQQYMLDHTPVPEKRERWRVLTKGGYSREQLQQAMDAVLFSFARADEELAKRGPWLAGKTYSLGDINYLAILHRVNELDKSKLDRQKFLHLMDWWDRSMARPGAKFAYSPDTDEVPKRPARKTVAGIAEYRVPVSA